MKRLVVGIVLLGCAFLLGVALRKVIPPPPVNSFAFGPNEAYAKANPTRVQVQERPRAGVVLGKDGTIEQIAKSLPPWAIWSLCIVGGVGMAAAQYGPLILFARRYNRQHATQPR